MICLVCGTDQFKMTKIRNMFLTSRVCLTCKIFIKRVTISGWVRLDEFMMRGKKYFAQSDVHRQIKIPPLVHLKNILIMI